MSSIYKLAGYLASLTGALAATIVGAAPSSKLLVGSVDSVDVAAKSVSVAGHKIATKDALRVVVGQTVSVYGTLQNDGSIVNAVLESSAVYLATSAGAIGSVRSSLSTGSGTQAELSTGSGTQAELSTGSGNQAELSTGSGTQAELSTGSGNQAELSTGSGASRE
jgi:hypothetical protein